MIEQFPISVIIPVFNMDASFKILWTSLISSRAIENVTEIIIINDGSTDRTMEFLNSLNHPKVKIVHFEKNRGRFSARFEGVKLATEEQILFLDARIRLPDNFSEQIKYIFKNYQSVVGEILIDQNESIYSLYWKLSHEFIFSNHYEVLNKAPIRLTVENYDDFLKGTTLFYCQKNLFLNICRTVEHLDIKSDDTYIMKEYVKHSSIFIDKKFNSYWSPRQDFKAFSERVWERGPSFVEYHVFQHRGKFFSVTCFLIAYFLVMMSFLFVSLSFFLSFLLFSLFMIFVTGLFFTRRPFEFLQIAPLHTATVVIFFVSILTAIVKTILKIKD